MPFPSQYDEKDKAFKEQLSHLAALLPTLQVREGGCRVRHWGIEGPFSLGQPPGIFPFGRFTWSSALPSSAWPTRLSSWIWAM